MKKIVLFLFCVLATSVQAQSVAGFYQIPNSGRIVYNFNQGWRFHLGNVEGAENVGFNDKNWDVVCAPHTARLEPSEASGGRNYQGICWYRKHFTVPADMKNKNMTVHFEAIMGKQKVFVNGNLVCEHEGGYLPIEIDLTKQGVKAGEKCLIAVMADNSDDKSYPPGKKQSQLDFCYHHGMYRDVWLIGKDSDAIDSVFVHYDDISDKSAKMFIDLTVPAKIKAVATVKDADGRQVERISSVSGKMQAEIKNPHLWSPEKPYLYTVEIRLFNGKKCVDGVALRTGIRKAEFRGQDGFWLNGKPYHKLIGGNRHQDFAYVGNAVPNSQQWRDVKRLKDAGMTIIRAAHYPQDPSFMDACDELGLFIIVPTPGWQYWNKDPKFAEKVHQNTREIIRRDRNHACVLMWEPVLNETRYPTDFAVEAHKITVDEYPFAGRPVAAADMNSDGIKDNYEVLYGWPEDVGKPTTPADKCVFTREFGEMVDDWYAHNCLNRASRGWGEKAMLDAALSLDNTYKEMLIDNKQFIGGCQWHPFDHQRGYHPDPYFGGIYDVFRQPKYALAAFKANSLISTEPYLFIANEMTQCSGEDVVIFNNCDSVRLTALEGDMVQTLSGSPAVFKGFWNFWKAREYSYNQHNWQRVSLLAEGFKGGKVVCTEKKMPSRRSTKIRLHADKNGKELVADGSDFIVIVAEITDDNGNVRRLAKEQVKFSVEGEGRIIGDTSIGANPRVVEWGSAPVLIQATNTPGAITVTARVAFEGIHAPSADTITIYSTAPELPACYDEANAVQSASDVKRTEQSAPAMSETEKRRLLEEVEQQQKDFGVMK